jgi:uncharacterized protein YqfB (UPF0267 family)
MLTLSFTSGGVLHIFKLEDSFLLCPIGVTGMKPVTCQDMGQLFAELLENFEDSEGLSVADVMDRLRDLPSIQAA